MLVIVAGVKGGTGKTTTAAHLAIERARLGIDVLAIDADPEQSNLYDFAGLRAGREVAPPLHTVKLSGKITKQVQDLSGRYQDIIVDCGGYDSQELRSALPIADVWIVPIKPTQFQLWTIEKLNTLLETCNAFRDGIGKPPLAAWLLAARHGTHQACRDRDVLADAIGAAGYQGFRVLSGVVRERGAFTTAELMGLSVCELPRTEYGADKGAAEIRALYAAVFDGAASFVELQTAE